MKILLKTICYILASLLLFGIFSGLFPKEKYGGASPSETYHQNAMLGIIFMVISHSCVFIYLFYKEFSLPKIGSIFFCFCLHFLLVSLGFYLSVVHLYDFIMENYPNLSSLISERDAYNDELPSTAFILFALGGFMIFSIWGSVSGLKKIINKKKNSLN